MKLKRAAIFLAIVTLGTIAGELVHQQADVHPVVYFVIGGLSSMIAVVFSETFTTDDQSTEGAPNVDINVLSKLH